MKIIIADNPAFCYGVERAYDLVKAQKGSNIFTWGPLIHNPQIVAEIKEQGIESIDSLEKLKTEDTVILRAHGVSDKTRKNLCNHGVKIIDGTCPFVTKAHLIAQRFIKNNYKLVILGDKNHPEIRGIYEDFPSAIVIKKIEDIAMCKSKLTEGRIGIICQTTIKIEDVNQIIKKIKNINPDALFENTICNATHVKQNSARKLAQQVDCMLVVGGKNSNNTKMLREICAEFCPTYLISDVEEINLSWFDDCEKIGITGGASTPLWLIKKVKERLLQS